MNCNMLNPRILFKKDLRKSGGYEGHLEDFEKGYEQRGKAI